MLASSLPEVKKIVEGYNVGLITQSHDPKHLAGMIQKMLSDKEQFLKWKENARFAAHELCWENEKQKLIELIRNAG